MTIIELPQTSRNSPSAPFTNSAWNPSLSELTEVRQTPIIDTIKVVWPISDHWLRHSRFKRLVNHDTGEVNDVFTSATGNLDGALLTVRNSKRGLEAVVERSVAGFIHGHNLEPGTIDQAKSVVRDLHNQASAFVDFIGGPLDARITRLDLNRGFDGVEHLDHLLGGLARLKVPRTANPRMYYDGEVLTLERRTTSRRWAAVLYDKHQQMLHLVRYELDRDRREHLQRAAERARNHLRFEVRLHRAVLADRDIYTMHDLDDQILLGLRQEFFRRARFDTPVHGPAHVEALLLRLAGRDPDYKRFGPVLSMLLAEALNVPPATSSSATLAEYRKLAARWQITAADVLRGAGPSVVLDYETGRLRTDVTA